MLLEMFYLYRSSNVHAHFHKSEEQFKANNSHKAFAIDIIYCQSLAPPNRFVKFYVEVNIVSPL